MHVDKEPEPLNLGVPVVNFPDHPNPHTGIALGTRLRLFGITDRVVFEDGPESSE